MAQGTIYPFGIRERLAAFMGWSHNQQRDLYKSFGYNRILLPEDFHALYKRNDIASRIVRAFPQATWRDFPSVYDEDGQSPDDSEFASAVQTLVKERRVQRALERADRVASIGRFGLLVMGFQDGQDPSKPLNPGKYKLLYLQPYGEYNITVSKWDQNVQSPRYGLPELYVVNSGSPGNDKATPTRSQTVHWTRCLHLSEVLDEDDVYGEPRLQCVYNRLKDLEKVVGGSAETFWLTANRGLALWSDPDAQLSDEEVTELKKQADEFQHQLRRYMVGSGMTAQVLGSDTPDPKPNVETLLDLVAGAVGMPKRILVGSERGELASSQDENNWFARIDERRQNFASPMIVIPFINKMVETGNLPEPVGEITVEWAALGTLGPLQEAEVAVKKSQALASYVAAPGADLVVSPDEFRVDILGMEAMDESGLIEEEEALFPEEDNEDEDVRSVRRDEDQPEPGPTSNIRRLSG